MDNTENKNIFKVRESEEDFSLPIDRLHLDEPTDDETHSGVYGLIVDAIQETWDTIDRYNSYIATIKEQDPENVALIKTLETILNTELNNVSILMNTLLGYDDNAAENITIETEE